MAQKSETRFTQKPVHEILMLRENVYRATMQLYAEWANFTPAAVPKPLNRSSPKFAWIFTSRVPTITQNFMRIR